MKIAIVGGGIVGVSCALNLQEKGFDVTLLDKSDVGKETSYGNAGVISKSSIIPLNNPTLYRSIHRYATNRHPAVRYELPYAASNLNIISKFILNSRKSLFHYNSNSLRKLISPALEEHEKWHRLSECNVKLRKNGILKLYATKRSFDNSRFERNFLKSKDIEFETLSSYDIASYEPAVKKKFYAGTHILDAASVSSPGGVVESYFNLFTSRGGTFLKTKIESIKKTHGGFLLSSDNEKMIFDQVVICLGPWSNELTKETSNENFPMFFERGYHYQTKNLLPLSRPIHDVEGCYFISPMEKATRISCGSELASPHSEKNISQLKQVVKNAEEAFSITPLNVSKEEAWCGSRPTLPDSLPVIGQSEKTPGLWYAFGHQHIGFSTGPATGRLLAELVSKESPFIDPRPFSPNRFF